MCRLVWVVSSDHCHRVVGVTIGFRVAPHVWWITSIRLGLTGPLGVGCRMRGESFSPNPPVSIMETRDRYEILRVVVRSELLTIRWSM